MKPSPRKFVVLRSPSVGNYENSLPAPGQEPVKKSRTATSFSELDTLWQEFSEQWQTYESSVTPTEPGALDSVRFKG